jgi:hypothetical protein
MHNGGNLPELGGYIPCDFGGYIPCECGGHIPCEPFPV